MKIITILFSILLLASVMSEDYNRKWDSLRIGSKPGATDVMLDGVATDKFKQYKYMVDENDVTLTSNENESNFCVHGIKLSENIKVDIDVAKSKLLTVTSTVTATSDQKDKFDVKISYKCADGLAGVSDVYISFYLDDNSCSENKIGIKKKWGSEYNYAPLEISETTFFNMKKNILTNNGGQSSHEENLFDKTKTEVIVIGKGNKSLSFRIKNVALPNDSRFQTIDIDPPIVRIVNEADNVLYPVLRGAGARKHTLKIGEYQDFKLEFNCISLDEDSGSLELIFRPEYFTHYKFKMTKECEGLTAGNLIKKEFQDSLVFDFFAFLFFFLVFMVILIILGGWYSKYKEMKGEEVDWKGKAANSWDAVKNAFKGEGGHSGYDVPSDKTSTRFESDDIEERNIRTEAEFDPNDILKTKSKKNQRPGNEDYFNNEIKVDFKRDEEDYQIHELKEVENKGKKDNSNAYGTL